MRTIAIEPHASTLPRVTFNQAQVRAEEGSPVQLPCVAQGNPPPTYSNPPTNRHLEEAVVVDWPKMMKFKAS
ncbi:hypothetical protein AVEN_64006-1 [Araneus ventricosus]|uniref:Ig-like domain-containing protein n=1 Tax=Araneus ventricosus TaxID=182803 RepID=A0A4Y2T4C7_ARAVE|nr:hypothetical protein AVEN_64006-1 [Araneus ventricosus]